MPPEKVGELAKFDGSVIVERTAGEVSARCDMARQGVEKTKDALTGR